MEIFRHRGRRPAPEPASTTTRYVLRGSMRLLARDCKERVMPMLFWLPMIFMSAMIELSAPAAQVRAPQAD
jgi:hypothetical protein